MPGDGYPMRLLVPGYQGKMNAKFLRRITAIDQPAMTFFETVFANPAGALHAQMAPTAATQNRGRTGSGR
jgi:DMSO/TMAO reductase YedYZ molybdopterin-dependent catalytic subunit